MPLRLVAQPVPIRSEHRGDRFAWRRGTAVLVLGGGHDLCQPALRRRGARLCHVLRDQQRAATAGGEGEHEAEWSPNRRWRARHTSSAPRMSHALAARFATLPSKLRW
eukprot:scaffold26872_cov64-Phaeocystis_antarctica.AAC.1